MTFQQLQYLAEISKCGSINKAAKRLFLSQSALSASIMELESEFGTKILKRTNRGVNFTPEGMEFLNYAVAMLDNKAHMEMLFRQRPDSGSVLHLRVSSQRYPFTEDAFLRFLNRHPDERFQFELQETSMHAVIDDIYDHRAEIGVIFMSEVTKKTLLKFLKNRDICFNELITMEPCVFCRRGHPLTKLPKVQESDLNDYPFVVFEHAQGVSVAFSEEYQMMSMDKPQQRIIINSRSTSNNIIALTDSISTGTGLLVKGISSENIVSLSISDQPALTIGWISVSSQELSLAAKEFIELLRESVRESYEYTLALRDDAAISQ